MSQIDQLKSMLNEFSGKVDVLTNIHVKASTKLDGQNMAHINNISATLKNAMNDAKNGDSTLLNKFISSHANINK